MKTWIFAAAVAAAASAGAPALASQACGPWGNDEGRCIGNNGLAHDQIGGLSGRNYYVSVKPKISGAYTFSVDIWRSTCGFPGARLSASEPQERNSSDKPFQTQEYAGTLQCLEFFFHRCKTGHTAASCADILDATIEPGKKS
jgi:hypothetical protein